MHERREAQVCASSAGFVRAAFSSSVSFVRAAFSSSASFVRAAISWTCSITAGQVGRQMHPLQRGVSPSLPCPCLRLQEARKSEEDKAKEQEQAANAYLHLNSYLALPPPSAAPDGGMGAQQPYGGGYGSMPQQF